MKSFSKFFSEARETNASAEAKKLGLKGDGHGGWYNKQGEFVAKTEGGELVFYGKDNKPGEKDEPHSSTPTGQAQAAGIEAGEKPQVNPQASRETPAQTKAKRNKVVVNPDEEEEVVDAPEGEETELADGVVVVFGRFNPPTIGHKKLLDKAAAVARKKGYELRIYPSRSQDAKKNPLTPDMKISYMRQMFPDYIDNIIDDKGSKTIFNVLTGANEEGHTNMTIMVGGDRLSEFQGLAHKYNGDLYQYDDLQVISAGDRDPDSDDVSGMSASKLRLAAAEGDFKKFAKGVPDTLKNMEKMELYNVIRRSMNISEETEVWEVAPKLDEEGMRDAYLVDGVYAVGDMVENVNTGLVGEVTRRGTNYIIAVTEAGMMFKSWLRDITEFKYYEVGTDAQRIHAQSITPGQEVKSYTGVKVPSIYDRFKAALKKNK